MAQRELAKQEEASVERTRSRRHFTPLADIYETEEALVMELEMPGVRKENVDVRVEKGILEVFGVVDDVAEVGEVLVREFESGSYHRVFQVSSDMEVDKITAKMTDGVLILTLPKAETVKTRKIEVKS